MKQTILLLVAALISLNVVAQPKQEHNLSFKSIPTRWDEALPLGNGMLGALIWQKGDVLRMSLDRADLWDLRPVKELDSLTFSMVIDGVNTRSYSRINQLGDFPYDNYPAPSKIPGAALQLNISKFGEVEDANLDLATAAAHIKWKNGVKYTSFISATGNVGWFRFEGLKADVSPEIIPPLYQNPDAKAAGNQVIDGSSLSRLGYKQGNLSKSKGVQTYIQEGWGGMKYKVVVRWSHSGSNLTGCWSITSFYPTEKAKQADATQLVSDAFKKGYDAARASHVRWWSDYWSRSAIAVPDKLLEKQWYLEQYKFGSASRLNAPPITLQAVWTADNGNLPPWKGDYHNDLNTQLSYWIGYSGNHLDEAMCFTDWLWKCRMPFKAYTKRYFGVDGLNAPGVNTLVGEPMGGWIQYSLGPTVGAWLGHHFYLQWKYSMDEKFLKEKAYPWVRDVAAYFEQLSVWENGKRKLPLSSSPEFNDNSIDAWFKQPTNFDLALIKWTFKAAVEMANRLGLKDDASHWSKLENEWPDFATAEDGALMIAPNTPLKGSHRHFSHMLAIHPLGVIDPTMGEKQKRIVDATLSNISKEGTRAWVGYSFSWIANFFARDYMGDSAALYLHRFASNFCSPNSFHLNGDQKGGQYSGFRYRPFTLEGNFAFASSLQEMMLQSHRGYLEIFPAIPASWRSCSFTTLRAEGAFLVSASKADGAVQKVEVMAEKGGVLTIKNPFKGDAFLNGAKLNTDANGLIRIDSRPKSKYILTGAK